MTVTVMMVSVAATWPRSTRNLGFPLIFLCRMLEMFMAMIMMKIMDMALMIFMAVMMVNLVTVSMMIMVVMEVSLFFKICFSFVRLPVTMIMLYGDTAMVAIQGSYRCKTEKDD